jgi:hypothetical protein
MASRKMAAPVSLLTRGQLELVVRDAIRQASALKSTDIKKALSKPNRSQHAEALVIARELAARGTVYRWAKGSAEWFFASDPAATLEKAVPGALAAGPLPADVLERRIVLETKVPKARFDEWKKGALARGNLFLVAAASSAATKSKVKLVSLEPDLRAALKVAIGALQKGLKALDAKGVSRERIARVLWEELGLPVAILSSAPMTPTLSSSSGRADRDAFLRALQELASEHPSGTLLAVGDLRSRLTLDKTRFDAMALSLVREGSIILHHHDHADGLLADDRNRLVRDANGTYYVGIAPSRFEGGASYP